MPYTIDNPPERIKALPQKGKEIFIAAFNNAIKEYSGDEERANATAWAAVKRKFKKEGEGWVSLEEQMPPKAKEFFESVFEEKKQEMSEFEALNAAMNAVYTKFPYMKKENKEDTKLFTFELSESFELSEDGYIHTPVMRIGKWKHPMYGEIEADESMLEDMKKNFEERARGVDLVLDENHDKDHKSRGVFKELYTKVVNGVKQLWAKIEPNELGKKLIQAKEYLYFSPEFQTEWVNPESGKKYKNVLFGGALTNRPFLKNMEQVAIFSELNSTKEEVEMSDDIKDDLNKPEDVKPEVKEEVVEVAAKEETVETASEVKEEIKEEAKEEPKELSEVNLAELSEPAKNIIFKLSEELNTLKYEKKMRMLSEVADSLVFSESNKEGKFKTTDKDELVGFLKELNEDQTTKFIGLVKKAVKPVELGEIGMNAAAASSETASEKITRLAEEKAKKLNISFSEAQKLVFEESPTLRKELYTEQIEIRN